MRENGRIQAQWHESTAEGSDSRTLKRPARERTLPRSMPWVLAEDGTVKVPTQPTYRPPNHTCACERDYMCECVYAHTRLCMRA